MLALIPKLFDSLGLRLATSIGKFGGVLFFRRALTCFQAFSSRFRLSDVWGFSCFQCVLTILRAPESYSRSFQCIAYLRAHSTCSQRSQGCPSRLHRISRLHHHHGLYRLFLRYFLRSPGHPSGFSMRLRGYLTRPSGTRSRSSRLHANSCPQGHTLYFPVVTWESSASGTSTTIPNSGNSPRLWYCGLSFPQGRPD